MGKTTTAVNLAASLAVAQKDVLLVDCDPQGNATSGLGIRLGPEDPTLYDVVIGRVRAEEALRSTEFKHLSLIGSNVNLFGAEVELVDRPQREKILADCLRPLAPRFSYIFLDCPPSLGLLTVNALTACDCVLIPLQCDITP